MTIKSNISRFFFITLWCIVGAGLLVLLGAAIRSRNNKACKGYRIDILNPVSQLFIDKKEIGELLAGAGAGKWQGKPILSFDLRHMESTLEKNVWIKDAELFFDNNEILRVNVTEREPVARIFTADGNSFYIDSSGVQLPLSPRLTAKLPVFTGYPSPKIRLQGADSALTAQIRKLSTYIRKDPFWMAQIVQVDITPSRTFEMVPMIGDHLIEFGDGRDYEQKFHRLMVFYKEVLSRTGFGKYSRIDVQYVGEVIGTQRGSEVTRVDSVQGIRNIQQLIRSAQQPDTSHRQNMRPLERNTLTEQTLTNYDLVPDNADSVRESGKPVRSPGKINNTNIKHHHQ
jgi:cell division protein FtsQ